MRILWWRMNANAAQARTIKGLILVAVGLGALTLSLPESSEPAPRGIALLDVDAKNVARFEDGSGSDRRLLERTAHGWSQSAPWTAEADSPRVEDQINALAQVQIERTPNVEGMTFLRRIALTETDGTQHLVRVGRRVPGASGRYLMVGNETWVSTGEVPSPLTVDEALDKRVFPFKRHKAGHIHLGPIEIEETRSGWRVRRDSSRWEMADQSSVTALIDALLDLRVETFSPAPATQEVFEVKISSHERGVLATRALGVDPWTVRVSDGTWVPMTPGLAPWIDQPLTRSTIFDFDPALVTRCTVVSTSQADALDLDPTLTERLLTLQGRPTTPTSIGDESVALTVHLAGHDQSHRVQFWKNEGSVFASHGEDYAPLELDEVSVQTLRDALKGELL